MASPTIGVLALQGDVREHCAHLEQCGVSVTTVRSVSDLNGVDGLVSPGGESTTMSILAVKNNLLEPLRELGEQAVLVLFFFFSEKRLFNFTTKKLKKIRRQ